MPIIFDKSLAIFVSSKPFKSKPTEKMYIDMNFWLPQDILLKADKMSMANSLELRVPLLDIEVFKASESIPYYFG